MSLQSKIEAVIYASEEPVTLQQLVGLLAGEAQSELDALASLQTQLELDNDQQPSASSEPTLLEAASHETPMYGLAADAASIQSGALDQGGIVPAGADPETVIETVDAGDEHGILTDEASSELSLGQHDNAGVVSIGDNEGTSVPGDGKRRQREHDRAIREHIRKTVDALMRDYSESERGIEIREVASGFRMGTKPEYHDAVRGFVKSLKPALKLTLPALETLAVVAYKQPVTAAEISEIRGVDSAGVLGGLMARKLIATAGRKQVIGRPMLYKTTRDFLLRFGLKDVNELPSMEEFERMAGELAEQEDLPMENTSALVEQANARGDAEHIREATRLETPDDSLPEALVDQAVNGASPKAGAQGETLQDTEHPKEATAESAAGGTDESIHTEDRVKAKEAHTEQPA